MNTELNVLQLLKSIDKRLKDLEEYVYNLDDYLPAHTLIEKCIGFIKKKDSITIEDLEKRFRIPQMRAAKLLKLLIEYDMVEKNDNLYKVKPDPTNCKAQEADNASEPLFNQALAITMEIGAGSTALLQRRLKIGYSRAAELIDMMQEKGYISPPAGDGSPRKILKKK